MKAIKSELKKSGKSHVFKSSVATKDNFLEMLKSAPQILHISCHGQKKNKLTGVTAFVDFETLKEQKEIENCLLFELESGEGNSVNSQELNNVIKGSPSIEVVFLAVCDSEFAGQIFLKCGAKHVICVKRNRQVLDVASIDFTKSFYNYIVLGMTVCAAFQKAKSDVEFKHKSNEADIFQIFTQEQVLELDFMEESKVTPHVCKSTLMAADEGEFVNKSAHVLLK